MALEIPRGDKEILEGICELHVHCSPDLFRRPFDEISFAKNASSIGYRAVLSKCHFAVSADRAQLIKQVVPEIGFFGGVVLNHSVGGLNAEAVRAAIGFGAKEIWMPTLHAENHIKIMGAPVYPTKAWEKQVDLGNPRGISILDKEGDLKPEVYEILDLIASADIILGTSHISREEVFALIKAAKRAGVNKMLVTHAGYRVTPWSIEDQMLMADIGAHIEYSVQSIIDVFDRCISSCEIAEAIKKIGADRCVMVTDLGQIANPHPIEGMRQFVYMMIANGIARQDIEKMTKDNPAKLLGL